MEIKFLRAIKKNKKEPGQQQKEKTEEFNGNEIFQSN